MVANHVEVSFIFAVLIGFIECNIYILPKWVAWINWCKKNTVDGEFILWEVASTVKAIYLRKNGGRENLEKS